MGIKYKPSTEILCENCQGSKVVCSYEKGKIDIFCLSCNTQSESGPNAIEIRVMTKIPKTAKWVGVFYGPWNKDEFELVEGVIREIIKRDPNFRDEWRFYKGRNLFTAWRDAWVSGRLVAAPTLCGLIDRVEKKCTHRKH